jgi:hypothetical protein
MHVAIAGVGSAMTASVRAGHIGVFHGELTQMTTGVERTHALIVEELRGRVAGLGHAA